MLLSGSQYVSLQPTMILVSLVQSLVCTQQPRFLLQLLHAPPFEMSAKHLELPAHF